MENILIATCGTSILTNARDIKNEILGDRNFNEMLQEESVLLKERIKAKLKDKKANEKECGVELNSTFYLIQKNEALMDKIYLIVSDSIEGELAGNIIKDLLIEKLSIKEVEIKKIDKLNISKEHDFAIKGLRNLAGEVSRIIRKWAGNNIMISPIGGLKAQIFVVGLIAQLFKIPAYYLYENSTKIVALLPLPISLDLEFFKENIEVLSKVVKEGMILEKEIGTYLKANPSLRNILEMEKIDGELYFILSPLGEIAYEKLTSDIKDKLPRNATEEEKLMEVQYKKKEAHADQVRTNPKFQNFIKNILETPYVTKVIINYYTPDNKGDTIKITDSSNKTEGKVLKFEYNNKQGLLGGIIFLTEDDEEKVKASIIDLYTRI